MTPTPRTGPQEERFLRRNSTRGRLTLAALTLGSGVAILDGSVVNVALRAIGADLGASIGDLQWVVTGYLLSLASLVIVGGRIGDRYGRKRIYLIGMALFLLTSVLCALTPSVQLLIAMRVLQGVGGALLTPGALAIIQSSFAPEDRAPAIGTWAGVSGIASAIGPFVGGWLVDAASWRWVFGINVPLCLIVIAVTWYAVPETKEPGERQAFDLLGAACTVLGLGALTFALTGAATAPLVVTVGSLAIAAVAGVVFVRTEARVAEPLVPPSLWGSRVFTAANLMTLLVYGAIGAVMFILVLQLQVSSGWSATAAGLSALPMTIILLLFSSAAGSLSARIGPRLPMSLGPVLCAAGALLLLGIGPGTVWWQVLPGMTVFGVGMVLLVAPLTATVLAAAPDQYAGVASGVNNAVARAGSLLAVAALPVLGGLSGDAYNDPAALTHAHQITMIACAALLAGGGIVSWVGLRRTAGQAIPR